MAEAGQEASEATGDEAGKQKKDKKKLIIIIALGSTLVIGTGVAAALLLSGGGASQNVEVTSAERATQVVPVEEPPAATPEQATEAVRTGVAAPPARAGEGAVSDLGIDFGDTYKMKTFHLNLGNALENRYVRLEVTLEFSGGEPQKREIEHRMPQLRDAVISIISRKTREFILAPDGKDALRKEVLIRINRYMKSKVDAVYITDILIE